MTAGMEADVFGVDPHGINEHDPICDFHGQPAILPMPIATWLEQPWTSPDSATPPSF